MNRNWKWRHGRENKSEDNGGSEKKLLERIVRSPWNRKWRNISAQLTNHDHNYRRQSVTWKPRYILWNLQPSSSKLLGSSNLKESNWHHTCTMWRYTACYVSATYHAWLLAPNGSNLIGQADMVSACSFWGAYWSGSCRTVAFLLCTLFFLPLYLLAR